MSTETCNRVPEALAAGMVWGDAALLEHAKNCEICATQLVVLKKRREFRDAFPVLSSIADEAPRADATTDDTRARAARRRHVLLMITAVVAIVLFIVRNRAFNTPPAPIEGDGATLGPPRFRIFNLANALFESKVEGATVSSSLTRGVAAFQVDRLAANQRFLLTLPDGNLEVRGTRFVVTVEAGKTVGVDVSDGTVALRLQGRAEIVLSAGDRWPADSTRPTVSFIDLAPSPRGDAGTRDPSKSKP
jgi:hypothetical protein